MSKNTIKCAEKYADLAILFHTLFCNFTLQNSPKVSKTQTKSTALQEKEGVSPPETVNPLSVKTIQNFHIGKPADTNREVIETGYAVSWFVQFANGADQASYQTDPIHLKFVEECSHVWSKVIVYDSVDV